MMVEDMPSLTEDGLIRIAANMRSSALNLFSLLENLLEWSRMQQGLIPFLPEPLSLHPLLEESLNAIADAANHKEIQIINLVPDDLKIFTDKRVFQTIVRNLVSNSVKFTKQGGEITLQASRTDEKMIHISVQDNGIGMTREMIGNLFRLGSEVSRRGTDNEPSTGLGLIICNDFIEKNGGKLWVESEVDKGSTFHFTVQAR